MNSLLGLSKKLCLHYVIGHNNRLLAIFCHVVYATLGLTQALPNDDAKAGAAVAVQSFGLRLVDLRLGE